MERALRSISLSSACVSRTKEGEIYVRAHGSDTIWIRTINSLYRRGLVSYMGDRRDATGDTWFVQVSPAGEAWLKENAE